MKAETKIITCPICGAMCWDREIPKGLKEKATILKELLSMEKRICPECSAENYSADTMSNWICYKCGAKILRQKEVIHNDKRLKSN